MWIVLHKIEWMFVFVQRSWWSHTAGKTWCAWRADSKRRERLPSQISLSSQSKASDRCTRFLYLFFSWFRKSCLLVCCSSSLLLYWLTAFTGGWLIICLFIVSSDVEWRLERTEPLRSWNLLAHCVSRWNIAFPFRYRSILVALSLGESEWLIPRKENRSDHQCHSLAIKFAVRYVICCDESLFIFVDVREHFL